MKDLAFIVAFFLGGIIGFGLGVYGTINGAEKSIQRLQQEVNACRTIRE